MNDELKVLLTLAAIVVGAAAFVWILRREDRARAAAGRGLFSLAYSTRLGWMMGISLAALTWWLLSQSAPR